MKRLLERDRQLVDARDEKGVSAILTALYHGQADIAMAILRRGPKLTLFEAAAAGDVARVREIVGRDRAEANGVAPDGYSPIGLAAFFKRREVVRYLLEAGADPRPASRQGGFTPLHSAVATDAGARDVEIVRMLLEKGADPNAKSQSGSTPLHTVAFAGDRPSLELLLKHGADSSTRNNDGKTAADIARERGHQEIADLLVTRHRQTVHTHKTPASVLLFASAGLLLQDRLPQCRRHELHCERRGAVLPVEDRVDFRDLQ